MSGMSKEFITWLVDNGFCSGSGGNECAYGRDDCMGPDCDVASMWPEIRYSMFRHEPDALWFSAVTVECVRNLKINEQFGPPFTQMVTHELRRVMPQVLRDSYERERMKYNELEQLKELLRGTPRHGLCANKEDHDPHPVFVSTLGPFWCSADQSKREPFASERRRKDNAT